MKQKTLKIKGMGGPRCLIFLHGFFSGRFKVAALNSETGCINSGYITEMCNLYDSLSHNRVKILENETKAVRCEAFDIMAEEAQIRMSLEEVKYNETQKRELIEGMKRNTIQEHRDAKKYQIDRHKLISEQNQLVSKHRANIKRLGEIDEKIRSCELTAKEELEATATVLQSIFATYTKGALLRPVQPEYIPNIERYDFKLYKQPHKDEDEQMRSILKEVFNYV